MKKILITALLVILCGQLSFANDIKNTLNNPSKAYKDSLKAAHEAKKNQEQWAKGEGNPAMAKAYQEGLASAYEAKRNQELWAKGEGDPAMAKAYQEGLEAANEAKKNQEQWARG